jgi:hypothetical protein
MKEGTRVACYIFNKKRKKEDTYGQGSREESSACVEDA